MFDIAHDCTIWSVSSVFCGICNLDAITLNNYFCQDKRDGEVDKNPRTKYQYRISVTVM